MAYIKSKSAEQAFKLVGTELGYFYDFLFTKISIHYNQDKVSKFLRVFCFLSVVSSLIAFSTIVDKSVHSKVDIVVTYLLLLGAICLDIYSFIVEAISTWAMVWLPIPENKIHKLYSKVVARRSRLVEAKMGIKSMGQHDLLYHIISYKTRKFIDAFTGDLLQYRHIHWMSVDSELKQLIYFHLVEKRRKLEESYFSPVVLDKLLNGKDENVLQETSNLHFDDLSLHTAEFTERIFVWHLATNFVYYDDVDRFRRGTLGSFCQIAKSLSDYMMYLVLLRPLMMPLGLTKRLTNRSVYLQAFPFLNERREEDLSKVRKIFISAVLGHDYHWAKSNSVGVFNAGGRLARTLQSFVTEKRWDHEEKWEMISKIWIEMMVYVASHCSWKEHAQQLKQGGEPLTHIALGTSWFNHSGPQR